MFEKTSQLISLLMKCYLYRLIQYVDSAYIVVEFLLYLYMSDLFNTKYVTWEIYVPKLGGPVQCSLVVKYSKTTIRF